MLNAGGAIRASARRLTATRPGLAARLRLFGLLLLLIPLFAGLQRLVTDAEAATEVRFVPREVPILVPVERIVERAVERIIYLPVPAEATPEPPAAPAPRP
jgi:hypothetical protein